MLISSGNKNHQFNYLNLFVLSKNNHHIVKKHHNINIKHKKITVFVENDLNKNTNHLWLKIRTSFTTLRLQTIIDPQKKDIDVVT